MPTPIRLFLNGQDHFRQTDMRRPWEDLLSGSGYQIDGTDFAGFAKTGASYSTAQADARYAPIVHTHLTAHITDLATALTGITKVGVLNAPHMTSPVVDAGGLTVTAGGLAVLAGTTAVQALTVSGTLSPTTDTTLALGGVANRWSNVYSVIGTFATEVTVGGDPGGTEKLRVNGAARFNSGLTVTSGGATITAGGLTVTAGGMAVSSNSYLSFNGATFGGLIAVGALYLRGATGVYVADSANVPVNIGAGGGLTTVVNGLSVTSGGATITAGGLTVAAGTATISGGTLNVGSNAGGTASTTYNSAAGNSVQLIASSGGLPRWVMNFKTGGAEGGANAGADFNLQARDDTGGVIDTPFTVVRAAGGLITLGRPIQVNGLMTMSPAAGAISVNTGGAGTGSISLGSGAGYFQKAAANSLDHGMILSGPASDISNQVKHSARLAFGTSRWTGAASATEYIYLSGNRNTATAGDHYLDVNTQLRAVGMASSAGISITSGGLSVAAGGVSVTGNSTIAGTLSGITTLTASTVIAALTGNASTSSTLATARNINGVLFNGSADITVTAAAGTITGATLAAGVTASSLTSVGILAAPHMTSAVVDSGGLTITAGGLAVTGNSAVTGTLSVSSTLALNGGAGGTEILSVNGGARLADNVTLFNAKGYRGFNAAGSIAVSVAKVTAADIVEVGDTSFGLSLSFYDAGLAASFGPKRVSVGGNGSNVVPAGKRMVLVDA